MAPRSTTRRPSRSATRLATASIFSVVMSMDSTRLMSTIDVAVVLVEQGVDGRAQLGGAAHVERARELEPCSRPSSSRAPCGASPDAVPTIDARRAHFDDMTRGAYRKYSSAQISVESFSRAAGLTSAPTDAQRLGEPRVAAVDVLRLGHLGGALGGQAGQHQRGAGADVVGDDRGAGEHRHAADDGVVAVGAQVGAEPGQLLGEHEPRLEDVLGDHRGARGDRGQRHRERLQVGREARVGQRRHVEGASAGVRCAP